MNLLKKLQLLHQTWRLDLVGPYREFFAVELATTDALRAEVFGLRYRVYCAELGWEDPAAFPDQLERDAYDACAVHCLLRHRASGLYAGTVRLVMPEAGGPEPPLPLLAHCGHALYDGPLHPRRQVPGRYGEISRLAVRSEFRRRPGEAAAADGHGTALFDWRQDERRRFPHIALGLYLAASVVGLARGLEGVYAVMEPRLARHLRYGGIQFAPVGAPVEFRGIRAPYYIDRATLLRDLHRPLRRLLRAIAADLHQRLPTGA